MDYIIFGNNVKITYPNRENKFLIFNLEKKIDDKIFLKIKDTRFYMHKMHIFDKIFYYEIIVIINKLFDLEQTIEDFEGNVYIDLTFILTLMIKNNLKSVLNENYPESCQFNFKICTSDKNSYLLKIGQDYQNKLILENKIEYKRCIPNIANYKKMTFYGKIYYLILVFEDIQTSDDYIDHIIFNSNGKLINGIFTKIDFENSDKKGLFLDEMNYSIDNIYINYNNYIIYTLNFANVDFKEFIYTYKNNCIDEIYDKLEYIEDDCIELYLNYKCYLCIYFSPSSK